MAKDNEIIEIMVDGGMKTAIRLGDDSFGVPKHLMQGEKMPGYRYHDGNIEPWYWQGLTSSHGQKYVYFDPIQIESITAIATTRRKDALSALKHFALILSSAPKGFADLQTGAIPLWRLYLGQGDDVLILPPDLSDVFSVMKEDVERQQNVNAFLKKDVEGGFRLISQFGQLLYFALTGIAPYADEKIRHYEYREIPLALYQDSLFGSLDEKTLGFINFILHAKSQDMRDIAGNRTAEKNMAWFASRTTSLSWNVENISEETLLEAKKAVEGSLEYKDFWQKTEKGAARHTFWRTKGAIIIVSLIAASCILGFGIPYVWSFFKPPYTQYMQPLDMIYSFYDAQNELDITKLEAPLKGTKAPQGSDITNLFVNSRTRMAYETYDPVVRAPDWIKAGKPEIAATAFIYGVTDVSIHEIDKNTYDATSIWYSPYDYEETEEEVGSDNGKDLSTGARVYTYRVTQRFTFTWNERGWYNITRIENTGYERLGVENVGTYAVKKEIIP